MGRKLGDRKDAKLVRKLDSMHLIIPMIMPGRCANEAFVEETIDLTNLQAYLDKKNGDSIDYKYNLFQVIVTALMKTLTLRPKLNLFIANNNLYERYEKTASFVVKKEFNDHSEEGLALIHAYDDDNIDSIHEKIKKQVKPIKSGKNDTTTDVMDIFLKFPRFLTKFVMKIFVWLQRHGWIPASLIETDPYHASVILSNLGSIKLHAGYHHLTDWGTTSVFVVVGERKKRPFFNDDGTFDMRDSVDIGLTIDERIADGYYYSKSIRLLKKLVENPELLEQNLNVEVDF